MMISLHDSSLLRDRSFPWGRFGFEGGLRELGDLVNLLERLIVVDRVGRIVLVREVVVDLDHGCQIGDLVVVSGPFDLVDHPFEGVWQFRELESLVLRDSYPVIHRRCHSAIDSVVDHHEREGDILDHPFGGHNFRFDDLRVFDRRFVAEVHPEDRNYHSAQGMYYSLKEVLDRAEDIDLVEIFSLDQDLDRTSVEEAVYP